MAITKTLLPLDYLTAVGSSLVLGTCEKETSSACGWSGVFFLRFSSHQMIDSAKMSEIILTFLTGIYVISVIVDNGYLMATHLCLKRSYFVTVRQKIDKNLSGIKT